MNSNVLNPHAHLGEIRDFKNGSVVSTCELRLDPKEKPTRVPLLLYCLLKLQEPVGNDILSIACPCDSSGQHNVDDVCYPVHGCRPSRAFSCGIILGARVGKLKQLTSDRTVNV